VKLVERADERACLSSFTEVSCERGVVEQGVHAEELVRDALVNLARQKAVTR
jgi:hypothetical protein